MTAWLMAGTAFAISGQPRAEDVAAAIKINEVMASNGETLGTKNGGAELDWLELRNDGTEPVDLTGWHLYDDPSKAPSKWATIEGPCVVPAHGFKIVWCDKSYTNWAPDEAHAAFGIGKGGGTVFLAESADVNSILASMELPPQMKDVSYGLGSREKTVLSAFAPAKCRIGSGIWRDVSGPVGMSGTTNCFTVSSYKLDPSASADIPAVEAAIASGRYKPERVLTGVKTLAYTNSQARFSTEFRSSYVNFSQLGMTGTHYAVLAEGVVSIPHAGDWTFSVGSDDGFSLKLFNEKQSFESEHAGGRTYGQTPAIFRIREPGAYNVRLLYFQRTDAAALDFSVKDGVFEDYEKFKLDGFHLVGSPASGVLHAGAWAGHVSADVSDMMRGVSDPLTWEAAFRPATALQADEVCKLKVRHSGGFKASVNGTVVADVAVSGKRTLADALVPAVIDIPPSLLVQGDNVLRITAVNDFPNGAEFLLSAEVVATRVAEEPVYFRKPTPGAANTAGGYGPPTPKVSFSEPHGYKTAPFLLELSCADAPDARIYYTLDGTPPTTSSTPYTEPIAISSTTCIRAAVPQEGCVLQHDASATYLFLSDILAQKRGVVPAGFPAEKINNQVMLYGMDQNVVNGPDRQRLLDGFTNAVATMSIVVDPHDLFDPVEGIYVNALACEGRSWERAAMVEQIDPRDPANGFSTAAGIRIRGGASRKPNRPKHSLRLFFRNDYGDGPLEFPLFGAEGAGEFKKIDLRTSQNYSWANGGTADTFVHETFSRDSQRDMGDLYTRSRFCHLFINGQYWGLYQTQERGDDDFAETYNGGEADHYDVIKTSHPGYVTGASEGTTDAWYGLWDMAVNEGFSGSHSNNYFRAMGLAPDGTRNPACPVYLDPTNLMDYMLCSHYVVDSDTPASREGLPNNLYAIRDRLDGDGGLKSQGFWFLRHDAEHSMGANTNYSKYTDDPTPYGTTLQSGVFLKKENFNPAELHFKLCENPDYRLAFADRFNKVCLSPGGALAAERSLARFKSRMAEIDDAVVCEAARWATNRQTRQTWLAACSNCFDFINRRTPEMLRQYRKRGWYPSVAAPAAFDANGLRIAGGTVLPDGATVHLLDSESGAAYTDAGGKLYYTLDGSDPRAGNGAVAVGAVEHAATGIRLPQGGATVSARYRSQTGEWSALGVMELAAEMPSDQVLGIRVAAVCSSTPDGGGDGSEFIVLTNLLEHAVSLEGLRITCAKTGKAPSLDLTIGAGHTIAASGTVRLTKANDWPDAKITNGSVDGMLYDTNGETVQTFHFDANWWEAACDGTGAHFIARGFGETATAQEQWKPSFVPPAAGSPGRNAIRTAATDMRIKLWLDGLAATPEGAASITNFAGTAKALTDCYLVGIPPVDAPTVVLKMLLIGIGDGGNVAIAGDLTVQGRPCTTIANGEIRLYRANTLEGLSTSHECISLGRTFPVAVPGGQVLTGDRNASFFFLKIQ